MIGILREYVVPCYDYHEMLHESEKKRFQLSLYFEDSQLD